MAKVNAALLDKERQIYLGMVEVEEDELGPQHLPQIAECDLPPGQYRWEPDKSDPDGLLGSFVPLPSEQRAVEARPTLEQALAWTLLAQWQANPELVADVALAWLDGVANSFDFKSYRNLPLFAAYAEKRGLTFKEG